MHSVAGTSACHSYMLGFLSGFLFFVCRSLDCDRAALVMYLPVERSIPVGWKLFVFSDS